MSISRIVDWTAIESLNYDQLCKLASAMHDRLVAEAEPELSFIINDKEKQKQVHRRLVELEGHTY